MVLLRFFALMMFTTSLSASIAFEEDEPFINPIEESQAIIEEEMKVVDITQASNKYKLAICAIFKDEAPFLKEWIEFHRLMGVDHFYLYSNLSTDNYQEVLEPYVANQIVDLIEWPLEITPERKWYTIQCDAYNQALEHYGNQTKWMAFIDIDEFMIPLQKNSLPKALKEFEKFGGVGINWQLYGTSHVEKVPADKLMIETLLYKGDPNRKANHHIKSIVRPQCVKKFTNAHFALYKDGYFQVDENKVEFEGPKSLNVNVNKLRINHYWTRDEDFFNNVKLASRKKRGWPVEKDMRLANGLNLELDPIMLKFVPFLRLNMGLKD